MSDTAASAPSDSSASTGYWLGLATLIGLVLFAYWPSMRGEFLWDDDFYVTNNTALSTADGIERIWMHNPEGGMLEAHSYPVPQFYPMTHTSFWAQTRTHDFTFPLKSWPFHLGNVLLHIGSAWLLWTILRRLNVPGAFAAAAIWALHPVQVESVAWITERKNVLSGFFFFASLLIYLRFCGLNPAATTEKRGAISMPAERWKLYTLALVLFICSILSKSVTGSLPAVVLLLIWWKRGAIGKDDILPLLPFFACAIAMGAVTTWFERNIVGAQGADWDFSPLDRAFIAGGAVWFYISKLLVPINLSFVYPRWSPRAPLLIAGLLAAVAVVFTLYSKRDKIGRGPLVVALLFGGMLFPALGFINVFPMRYSFVADHFQYLACAALIAGIVWRLHCFFSSQQRFAVAVALILGALTAVTWKQNHVYTSPLALWMDTIRKNDNAWMAHNNLGALLKDAGQLDPAEQEFRTVLKIRPTQVEAMMNLGLVAEKRGALPEAIECMKSAIQFADEDPIHAPSYAQVYFHLGRLMQLSGDNSSALYAYRAAFDANHKYVPAINKMGELLLTANDLKRAKAWFIEAIKLDPRSATAHLNLGTILAREGELDKAMKEWDQAQQLEPRNVVLLNNLGLLALGMDRPDAAVTIFKKALTIQPDYEPAQRNLARAIRAAQEASTRPTTRSAASAPATTQSPESDVK